MLSWFQLVTFALIIFNSSSSARERQQAANSVSKSRVFGVGEDNEQGQVGCYFDDRTHRSNGSKGG